MLQTPIYPIEPQLSSPFSLTTNYKGPPPFIDQHSSLLQNLNITLGGFTPNPFKPLTLTLLPNTRFGDTLRICRGERDIPSGIFSRIGCWLIMEPWVVGLVLVVVNTLVFGSLYSNYSHKRIWYISLQIILMMFMNFSMFVILVIGWL